MRRSGGRQPDRYPGRQSIRGTKMSLVLVNSGLPQGKQLPRKLTAVRARALKHIRWPCARPKILKNISLKGAKLLVWPRRQINTFLEAHMIRASPEMRYMLNCKSKTFC